MSGGSMEYLYHKVDGAIFEDNTRLRRLFRKHLNLVAKALHDIEWVDSCDYGPGDEEKAILKVLNFKAEDALLEILREESEELARILRSIKET